MKMRMVIELIGNETQVKEVFKNIKNSVITEVSDKALEGFGYREEKVEEKKEHGEIQIPSFMTQGQKGRIERKSMMVGRG